MSKPISRREAMAIMGAAGTAFAVGCATESPNNPSAAAAASATTPTTSTNAACAVIPSETAGPYPSLVDLFRSDVREGKPGTLFTLTLKVVNAGSGCAPVPNVNVEIWHCDAVGNYSEYGTQTNATYLRGIQTTNANGEVTFTTIYPGWYQGRATHIHVEVTINGRSVKVTQIAFPEDVTAQVYRTGVYAPGGQNPTSNARDMVFSDGVTNELITLSGGDAASGFTATFQVGVAL